MAKNEFQFFLGIGLPEKEDAFFNYLKQQFHPQNRLSSPAHITLISPLYLENLNKINQKLKLTLNQEQPFCTIFEEIGSFYQKKYGTVYLAPNKPENFFNINTKINEVIFNSLPKRKNEFVPHLTIANRIPLGEVENVKEKLKLMKIKLELNVNSVYLYRRKVNQSWEKFEIYEFKTNPSVFEKKEEDKKNQL
jgi:2'-5' RNA ligase